MKTIHTSLACTLVLALGFYSASAFAQNTHRIDPPEPLTKNQQQKVDRAIKKKNRELGKKFVPEPKLDIPPAHKDFAMYRTGRMLSAKEFDDMVCGPEGKPDQAIGEIWVLSNKHGDSEKQYNDPNSPIWQTKENKGYKRRCDKTIKVQVFPQKVGESALTKDFLDKFDAYVDDARKNGKKIAFRCDCGCHRTGRLAAYYEMKYMGKTPAEAWGPMKLFAHGKPDGIGKWGYWLMISGKLWDQSQALYQYIHGKACTIGKGACVAPDELTGRLAMGKNTLPEYEDLSEEQKTKLAQNEAEQTSNDKVLPVAHNRSPATVPNPTKEEIEANSID